MKISSSYESIKIDQSTYARNVVSIFEHLLSSNFDKIYTTPMDQHIKITKMNLAGTTEKQAQLRLGFHTKCYRRSVLSTINFRPYLSYSAGVLACHCINPSLSVCQTVFRGPTLLLTTPDNWNRVQGDRLQALKFLRLEDQLHGNRSYKLRLRFLLWRRNTRLFLMPFKNAYGSMER